tara:strand:- start:3602 stop:3823 length:222 start_codon:yes stop_codon:yes gene_type:complete
MPHAQVISVKDKHMREMIIGHKVVARVVTGEPGSPPEQEEGIIVEAHEDYCLARFGDEEKKVRWGQVMRVYYR